MLNWKICDINFEKTKGVYVEETVQRVPLKSCCEKFRRIHKKNRNSVFLIKLNSVDLQLPQKRGSSAGVFL